jgi:hypothetical protein
MHRLEAASMTWRLAALLALALAAAAPLPASAAPAPQKFTLSPDINWASPYSETLSLDHYSCNMVRTGKTLSGKCAHTNTSDALAPATGKLTGINFTLTITVPNSVLRLNGSISGTQLHGRAQESGAVNRGGALTGLVVCAQSGTGVSCLSAPAKTRG